MPLVNITPISANKPIGKRPWYRSPKLLRHTVMALFFVFLLRVAYHHNVLGGGPKGSPSVEAYCPFGAIESVYQFATTGGFLRRIEPSTMILGAAVLLLTLVFSRGFCGWICPFGSIQEWIGLLGRKLFGKAYNPTGRWDHWLRGIKYVLLALIVAFTWYLGTLVFRPYDPFIAFFHLGSHIDEMPWAYAILGVVLIGSLKIERFFCKYACPLGAVLGIIGRFGLTRLKRDDQDCKACNICQKKCFAHVDFLASTEVRDIECNHCLDCLEVCPKPNVLSIRGAGFRFSHGAYAALLVAGLLGLVGVSKLAGAWSAKPEAVTFTNTKGALDPGAIRGWMTLNDVSQGYGIPLDRLYRDARLPASVKPETRLNQIATVYKLKFEPDSVRETVSEILLTQGPVAGKAGQPPKAPAGTQAAKPAPAQPSPKWESANSEPARQTKAAGAGQGPGAKKQNASAGAEQHGEAEESGVKGFMTLNEVALKTGVPKDYILGKLGIDASKVDPRLPLREWVHAHGHSVPEIRTIVEEYQKSRK